MNLKAQKNNREKHESRPISVELSAVVGRRDHLFGFIEEKSRDAQNYSDSSLMRSQIFQRAERDRAGGPPTDQLGGREATRFRSYDKKGERGREREREREREMAR